MRLKKCLLFAFVSIYSLAFAKNYNVNTLSSLTQRMTNAQPGDTVTVLNGTYSWGAIAFTNNNGTPTSAWIVLRAQTLNGVVFSGNTYLQFGGNRIFVTGFKFANGNAGSENVIQFRGGSGGSSPRAYYSRINNITVDNYNSDSTGYSSTPPAATNTYNSWVALYGAHNRMDHCTFINKFNGAPTVVVLYDSSNYPGSGPSTYHLIDSNYFKIRGWQGGNQGETIRVGLGSMSNNDGFNIVEYNLFQYGTSSDPEIISNKSNKNTYRYNTFKDVNGGITLRQGRRCKVYSNFFIKTTPNSVSTEQYGIRVIDKGHQIFNNYIEGVNSNFNKLNTMPCPIVIYSGYSTTDSLVVPIPRYYSADSAFIGFNTIVNCYGGAGIQIGFNADGLSPYKPHGLVIANNLIKMSKGQAVAVDTATPIGEPVSYFAEGNIFNSPNNKLGITNAAGFTSKTLTFGARSNGVLLPPSLVQDAALNTATYASIVNGLDANQFTRSATYDVGATEFNRTGTVVSFPLDSTMVGAGTPIFQLPVLLSSFTGNMNNEIVHLNWKVQNEINLDGYDVEISEDGNQFNKITSVKATNSTTYHFEYKPFGVAKHYYRLKLMNTNGSFTYSNAILLTKAISTATINLFPNPSKGFITVKSSGIIDNTEAIITDFSGKVIKKMPITNGFISLDVAGLNSGTYNITLKNYQQTFKNFPFVIAK